MVFGVVVVDGIHATLSLLFPTGGDQKDRERKRRTPSWPLTCHVQTEQVLVHRSGSPHDDDVQHHAAVRGEVRKRIVAIAPVLDTNLFRKFVRVEEPDDDVDLTRCTMGWVSNQRWRTLDGGRGRRGG